jgi:hypothetical protein
MPSNAIKSHLSELESTLSFMKFVFLIVLQLLFKNRDKNYRAVSIWIVVWNEDFESENSFLVNALTNENDAIPN